MKAKFVVLGIFACILLAFCIAAAITSQALQTWWKIETTNKTDKKYYFGLYEVCVDKPAIFNVTASQTKCYKFDRKGMEIFVSTELTTKVNSITTVIEAESVKSRIVWILSFMAILFTGMAFLVSVPVSYLSHKCHISKAIPFIQCVFTAIGTVLGVTSVAFAYDEREAIWMSGVNALTAGGITTGYVKVDGFGFMFQCIYSGVEILAFLVYLIMYIIQPGQTNKLSL